MGEGPERMMAKRIFLMMMKRVVDFHAHLIIENAFAFFLSNSVPFASVETFVDASGEARQYDVRSIHSDPFAPSIATTNVGRWTARDV